MGPGKCGRASPAFLPNRGGELWRRNWLLPAFWRRQPFLDPPPEKQCRGMKTLVLIDSDALSRALFSECLAGEGWRVFEAEEGESGLELILEHQPAAVICDLRAPKRNGFKVCQLIR